MSDEPKYLIGTILPAQEVHLIGGPSGSGKSTWVLQTLVLDWQQGKDVLGFKSHPVPWVYISADRSLASVHRTLERMHIDPMLLRIYSAVDEHCTELSTIIETCIKMEPKPRLLVIEGLQSLLEGSERAQNSYKPVAKFLITLAAICKLENLTIIGIVHTAKMKSDSEYLNPRQRVSGSVAWAAYSETILLIEPVPSETVQVSPERTLYVLPRNSKEFTVPLVFEDAGRLLEVTDTVEAAVFMGTFSKLTPHKDYTLNELLQLTCLALSTLQKRLKEAIKSGRMVKVSHGVYRIVRPS